MSNPNRTAFVERNPWTPKTVGQLPTGDYYAYPVVAEGIAIRVSGEDAAQVARVANQIEREVTEQ